MIRVALGSVYPYDESRIRGGVEAVALYLTRALAKRDDVELHVVSCNSGIHHSLVELRGAVTFHWLPKGRRFSALRGLTLDAWNVRQAYAKIKPQVIHAQAASEYAIAARSRDRLLLTIHGVEPLVPMMRDIGRYRGPAGFWRWWISNEIVRVSVRHASAIISIAGDYIPQILGPQSSCKRVHYICNPICEQFFSVNTTCGAREPVLLFVGTILERKNIIGLLSAFAKVVSRIPEAKLHIAGPVGNQEYYKKVQNKIFSLGLQEHVILLGSLHQRDLLNAYAKASVVALCSIQETAPMVIAQAMAVGKPVVATSVGGIPWMIEDGRTGFLVDAGDTHCFADRIIELLQDNNKRQQMGKEARQVAREVFSADKVAEKTVNAYRELIELQEKND